MDSLYVALAPKISAVRAFIGPDMVMVNKIDISAMQVICRVKLLLVACMTTIGTSSRSIISAVMHKCVTMPSAWPSNRKTRFLSLAADIRDRLLKGLSKSV